MFGIIFWFGIILSLPLFLATIFVYPQIKHLFNKYSRALLFVLISFAAYAFCGVLYLGTIALISAKPDDMSFLFVFIHAGVFFYIRRKLPNPKSLKLFLVPTAAISTVMLYYWIRSATLYGISGSAGWISYMMFDGIPFGAVFSELQMIEGWGWVHIVSAFFPLFSAFIGAGTADYLSDKENTHKNK